MRRMSVSKENQKIDAMKQQILPAGAKGVGSADEAFHIDKEHLIDTGANESMEDCFLRGSLRQRIALDSQMIDKFELIVNDGTLSRSIDSGMAKLKLQQDKEAKERAEKRRQEKERKEAEKSGKKATKISTHKLKNSLGRVI